MHFTLTINGDASELPDLLARLGDDYETSTETPAGEPAAPKKRRGKATAAAPTQNPDGTVIPPTPAPVPQPTPGGTSAPPAESIPPNQGQAAVDPFAASATPASGAQAGTPAQTELTSGTGQTAPTPASPSDGPVTYDMLKDAMTKLLGKTSAQNAQKVLLDATGQSSLTALQSQRPDLFATALQALQSATPA